MANINWIDAEELAAKICAIGDDYDSDDVESALQLKYEISFDAFCTLIEDLVPMPIIRKSIQGIC